VFLHDSLLVPVILLYTFSQDNFIHSYNKIPRTLGSQTLEFLSLSETNLLNCRLLLLGS
jgi:hypothetical protein